MALEFNGTLEAAVGKWLEESEVQALASAMDVRAAWYNISADLAEAPPSIVDCWRGSSHVEFDWGAWLMNQDHVVVQD